MNVRSGALAGLILLLVVSVSGCRDGEVSAEPTPIMAPTTAPTSAASLEPEPWEVRSRAGVEAFLKRYVEIFFAALDEGEVSAFRALGTDCEDCDDVADQIEEVYDAGGHVDVSSVKFTGWSLGENGLNGGQPNCTVVYRSTPATWVRRPGAKPETYPGGTTEKLLALRWTGERWTIIGLVGLPPE